PLHWFFWQSAGVWFGVATPAATFAVPQTWLLQVRNEQSVSWPGHCDAVLHATQVPDALQKLPPFWLHGVFTAAVGHDGVPFALHAVSTAALETPGTPLVQVSTVQEFPSSAGRSVSSAAEPTLPAPSQVLALQSCAVWVALGVPAAVKVKPHTPIVQLRCWHS